VAEPDLEALQVPLLGHVSGVQRYTRDDEVRAPTGNVDRLSCLAEFCKLVEQYGHAALKKLISQQPQTLLLDAARAVARAHKWDVCDGYPLGLSLLDVGEPSPDGIDIVGCKA